MLFSTLVLLVFSSLSGANIPESHRFVDTERKVDLFTGNTGWDFFSGEMITPSSTDLQLEFVARAPQVLSGGFQPTLTMRIDKSEAKSSRNYAEKWLKEFPKFGYELQMSREVSYGSLEGYEIELSSNLSNRRIRQFLVKKNPGEMWVFTCSSDQNHYGPVFKDCENILKTAKTVL